MATLSKIKDRLFSTVFTGTGGSKPGLVWTGAADELKGLSLDSSIYAGDVDIQNQRIAVSTKNGGVYVLSAAVDDKDGLSLEMAGRFFCSANITSLCFAGGDTLVIADSAAGVVLWDMKDPSGVGKKLPSTADVICSLCRVDDNIIAGLSIEGRLFSWDTNTGDIIGYTGCKMPDAAVIPPKLIYWKDQNALVWPAKDGYLASCRLDSLRMAIHPAHLRRFSAVFVDDGDIVTIGAYDRKALRWSDIGQSELICRDCPEGIIDGAVDPVSFSSKKYRLIDGLGKAMIYSFENNTAKKILQLPGCGYRSVIAAGRYDSNRFIESKNNATVTNLMAEAQNAILTCVSVDGYCEKLKKMGFERLSLGLKAKAARADNDVISELAAYQELACMLDKDDRRSFSYLAGYIEILIKLWQSETARELIYGIGFNIFDKEKYLDLIHTVSFQKQRSRLAVSSCELPTLIEACNITETKFTGRWLLDSPKPLILSERGVTVAALTEKYNRLRESRNLVDLPKADEHKFLKVYDGGVAGCIETAVFDGPGGKSPALYYAVAIEDNGCFDTIVPMSILEAASDDKETDIELHNERMLKFHENIIESQRHINWPGEMGRLITIAAAHLINQLYRDREKP